MTSGKEKRCICYFQSGIFCKHKRILLTYGQILSSTCNNIPMRKIGTQNKRMVWMERKVEETSSSMHLTKWKLLVGLIPYE